MHMLLFFWSVSGTDGKEHQHVPGCKGVRPEASEPTEREQLREHPHLPAPRHAGHSAHRETLLAHLQWYTLYFSHDFPCLRVRTTS